MKHLIIGLLTIICLRGFGQPPQSCTDAVSNTYLGSGNFLADLVPDNRDSILYVNLNVVVFKPSVGPGNWIGDWATVNDTLRGWINGHYSNLIPSGNWFPNAPFVPDTRIRFRIKNFQTVVNDVIYNSVETATTTAYVDTNAINIFFANDISGQGNAGERAHTDTIPSKFIFFPAASPTHLSNYYLGGSLAHELGHALGLMHNEKLSGNDRNFGTGFPFVTMPQGSCCQKIYATDYDLLPEAQFTAVAECTVTGNTNNIMSYNGSCLWYLSPRQIAIMHYHLRTDLVSVLKSNSRYYALQVNPAYNYTVTGYEYWTYDRYMKGNVIVEPNGELVIGCLVAMPRLGKIVVKKKAKLLVYGGTLTNISHRLWTGVEVEGDWQLPQVINPVSGFSTEQGIAHFWPGTTVSNARAGVCANLTIDTTANPDYSKTGGIVRAYFTQFVNNVVDVNIHTYQLYQNISRLDDCEFKITGKIKESALPDKRVYLCNLFGVQITGCNFNYAAGNTYVYGQRGYGIYSTSAAYNVDQSINSVTTFSNFTRGVYAINGNLTFVVSLKNSRFIDNDVDGAYIHNMDQVVFENNYLKMSNMQPMGTGLYMNQCQNYTVKNNTFEGDGGNGIGMYARLSLAGGHQVYRNTFSNLYLGIGAVDNNSGASNVQDGLKMNCNEFSISPNQYDIMVAGSGTGAAMPSVMKTQGVIGIAATATNVVRNKYGAACSNQSKWYTAGNSTKIVDHGSTSDAITKPLPQPGCSNGSIVNVAPILTSLNYTLHCPFYLPSGGGPYNKADRLSHINSYLVTQQTSSAPDPFELKATMAAKLEWYQSDTLSSSKDSVINILKSNPGSMSDADIQLVFAYMNKGDYVHATSSATALTSSSRADWKALLLKLIDIDQEPQGIFSVNTNTAYKSFLQGYANTDGKDGQGIAQAILKTVCGINYTEPRPLPDEGSSGARTQQSYTTVLGETISPINGILVFPNPAQNSVNLRYTNENETPVLVELKDLLGKIIYTNFISTGKLETISLLGYTNGIYILTVSRNKELLYSTKLVKQE